MPYAAKISILAKYQQELVGLWENKTFGKDQHGKNVGGNDNPLSYNIMPLPQTWDTDGYILKNFKYHERLHFNNDDDKKTLAIAAEAPNRGGLVSQNARAIFYEQQVRFAEGPANGKVVHVENGMWLWLPRFVQQDNPYPPNIDAEPVTDALSQPSTLTIAKQISVPHGNAILALGSFDTISTQHGEGTCKRDPVIPGIPVIPDAPFPYPFPEDPIPNTAPTPAVISNLNVEERYTTLRDALTDYQNPHPDLTQCPNKPLQEAVAIIKPEYHMHWRVTTEKLTYGKGEVFNIPFEERASDVTDYIADYWMLLKGREEYKGEVKYKEKYLAYTQTILMTLMIKGEPYTFPHVTCNTLTFIH